ncbi:hypothetical protein EPICR_20322 [Candidatus Desulfarcum epimagneticum]|uniref:Uncharacterized protein n=1 Tax=uncultured Desulfobacteraceae bacterium TaxID=218296 RepID=A0A484HHF7_9BACT|nr:hypothetical protein EPICR_20322 [uncultured Desulfobacteraceae bacterium]
MLYVARRAKPQAVQAAGSRKHGAGGRKKSMSEKNPECPLYNPFNCKEYYNPKLCAFAKKDKVCLKKKRPRPKAGENGEERVGNALS